MQIEMYEKDPAIRELIGVPEQKPKIKNAFYEATEIEKAGQLQEANKIYRELLNNDFENGVLRAALGMNEAIQGNNGVAYCMLHAALERCDQMKEDFAKIGVLAKEQTPQQLKEFITGKKAEIMNAIGSCWKHENKTDKARYWFERGQSLIPTNPDIQNNLATLYINEGHPEKSLKHLKAALEIQPTHPHARWNQALANLELGNYKEGFGDYHWGKAAGVRADRVYSKHAIPEWDGSPGKTVIVYGEQGIGDEIMYASLIPDMIQDCKQVIFDCHKKLHRLFCNSFPMLDIYATREDEHITWPYKQDGTTRYQVDARISIGDVPKFYRKTKEDFPGTPYLEPTAEAVAHGKEKLAMLPKGKPNIGIAWIGGHKKTRIDVRAFALEQMLPILELDANWVSLQYTPCEAEIDAFERKHEGIKIHHWPEVAYNEHYDETAGLVAGLDLVICCCTSMVHLCGSMGVPAWVLTPSRPAWRYRLDLDYMPWYGRNNTLFRQAPDTVDWAPVIQEVAGNLRDMLGAIDASNPQGAVSSN